VRLEGHVSELRLVGTLPVKSLVTYVGTEAPEKVHLGMTGRPHVELRMSGGDDAIKSVCGSLSDGSVVNGGPGHDRFHPDFCGPAYVDLDRHVLDVGTREPRQAGLVNGIEDVIASGTRLVVVGTERANVLRIEACGFRLDGGGGADKLTINTPFPDPPCGPDRLIRGGAGNDRMYGSYYDDVIIGGPGEDYAYGSLGRDRCVAEKTSRCEVTR